MNTIKELKQVKAIRNNAVNQLLTMLPNYEVAKRFADALDCTIQDALIVANDLVPRVDVYYKRNDRYYHVYKYNVITQVYTVKVLYVRQVKNSDGSLGAKWQSLTDYINVYAFDEAEAITKEEFESIEVLAK